MASTYSTSLKLELIGNGDQSGTWGTTTNTNLGTLLEQAITGVQNITMANADVTLTTLNGASDQARNAVLVVGGTNSAIRNIIAPAVNKLYVVKNNTSGSPSGFAIIIKTASSTGVTIANGTTVFVYCDGSEFYLASTSIITSSANVANTVALRDGSGNFAAGTITAALTGNVTGNATTSTTATNIAGGVANQIPYQTGVGTTAFVSAPAAANTSLSWDGSALIWSPATAGGLVAGGGMFENTQTISVDYTITAGSNGMSTGPITVASGYTVTVPTGSRWVVL